MGTTESVLYGEDNEVHDEDVVAVERRARIPTTQSQHGRRNRPRPATQVLLQGCVLGMSKSGKTSLLERFQGREPIARRSSIANDPEESESIDIPFKAPPNAPTWHDRIRLHVTAMKKLQDDISYDFFIILLDPRKPADKVQKYLTKTIRAVAKRQREAPLCLCLLRSFRDALEDKETSIASTDLTSWTLECLGQLPVDASRLVLQQLDISLVDCYGLAQLHQFIYQAYAQSHTEHLRNQLNLVRDAQRNALQPQLPYETFLQETNGTKNTIREAHTTPPRRIILSNVPQPDISAKSTDALEAFLESSDEEVLEKVEQQQDTDSAETLETISKDGEEEVGIADVQVDQEYCYTKANQIMHETKQDHIVEASNDNDKETFRTRKFQQTAEQSSKEAEGPPAAGEPTEDMSKPAIQDSFFDDESDHESVDDVVESAPLQAFKNSDDNDDSDDDEFFISHIDGEEDVGDDQHDDAQKREREEIVRGSNEETESEPPKDYNPEIKAALEAAKEDFDRMLKEKDSKPKKTTKSKKKKDLEKKKRKDSGKNQKERLAD